MGRGHKGEKEGGWEEVQHVLTRASIHFLKGVTNEGDIQHGPCPDAAEIRLYSHF